MKQPTQPNQPIHQTQPIQRNQKIYPNPSSPSNQRIACIAIPALPLQLVLRERPEWRSEPVVIVEDDRPLAEIIWTNRAALDLRVQRGMRFGQAQALASRLRAAVVPAADIATVVNELLVWLLRFSPNVEPAQLWPGVFWVDASGLELLYATLRRWAEQVRAAVAAQGFVASVVVGFQRFSVFAIARTRTDTLVLTDAAEEARLARNVPLAQLDISPKLRDQMAVLGVHTLGDFLALRASDLRLRYGEEAEHLHAQASGVTWEPLKPEHPAEAVHREVQIEPADDDLARLLFTLKSMLHEIVNELVARSEAMVALRLVLSLDHASAIQERIEAAAPTLDVVQLLDLVRLRLSAKALAAPVTQINAEAEALRVHPEQLLLLRGTQKRDLAAARRAMAQVKAAFGHNSVVRAKLLARHLPESSFRWEPIHEVNAPAPAPAVAGVGSSLPLVRRLYAEPVALPPMPTHEPEGWLGVHGSVQQMHGPYRISGGWWLGRIERDYFYAETTTGEILWLYYDRPRRRWFLHGIVD